MPKFTEYMKGMRVNQDGSVVLRPANPDSCGMGYCHDNGFTLPAKQARIVAENVLSGVPYFAASPMYHLTREQVAFIHLNAKWLLKRDLT